MRSPFNLYGAEMTEMLGNQYFMARNYKLAQEEFDKIFTNAPEQKAIKKKLVVCYTQTGRLKDAIKYFMEIVSNDINLILDTDPVKDDCPCPELIEMIENQEEQITEAYDRRIVLGIIWLYCDINKSLKWFEQALEIYPSDASIKLIIEKIRQAQYSNLKI